MNTKLITALRTTAKALEQSTFYYDWRKPSNCNCGSLFCALMGKSSDELKSVIPKGITKKEGHLPTWSDLTGQHCPISGLSSNELFKQLMSFGLTPKDIVDLEYLRNAEVLKEIALPLVKNKQTVEIPTKWYQRSKYKIVESFVQEKINCENKEHVILYMRAWADLLTRQGKDDVSSEQNEVIETVNN